MPKLKPGTIIPTEEEDAIIDAGIAADPDTYELQDADVAKLRPVPRGRPPKSIKKVPTTIRLDADVIEFFQHGGPGWQSRINEALRKVAGIKA
jgi:uncharacterized protein (DUF4415 family)